MQRRAKTLAILFFCLVSSVLIGILVYEYSESQTLEQRRQEADRLVALSTSFIRRYSALTGGHDNLPVPATFRAQANRQFNENFKHSGEMTMRMVGIPGRQVATAPESPVLRSQLLSMFYERDYSERDYVFKSKVNEIESTNIRSIFPSIAASQECVDCHNRIQNLELPWQVGDLMGAQIIDQDISQGMLHNLYQAIATGLLSASILFLSFSLLYKNRRLGHQSRKLQTLVGTDALTGSLNRRALFDVSDQRFHEAGGYGGLLLLDLDYFKAINDTYGHEAGDQVLVNFTAVVRQIIRSNDIVARIGGEEFVVCMPGADEQGLSEIAERIRAQVERTPVMCGGQSIRYTVSIGAIVVDLRNGSTVESWMYKADKHLYKAKEMGRNTVILAA